MFFNEVAHVFSPEDLCTKNIYIYIYIYMNTGLWCQRLCMQRKATKREYVWPAQSLQGRNSATTRNDDDAAWLGWGPAQPWL